MTAPLSSPIKTGVSSTQAAPHTINGFTLSSDKATKIVDEGGKKLLFTVNLADCKNNQKIIEKRLNSFNDKLLSKAAEKSLELLKGNEGKAVSFNIRNKKIKDFKLIENPPQLKTTQKSNDIYQRNTIEKKGWVEGKLPWKTGTPAEKQTTSKPEEAVNKSDVVEPDDFVFDDPDDFNDPSFAAFEKSMQSLIKKQVEEPSNKPEVTTSKDHPTEEKHNIKFSEYAKLLKIFKDSNQGLKIEKEGIRPRSQSTSAIANFFSTDRSKSTQKALSEIFTSIHNAIRDGNGFYTDPQSNKQVPLMNLVRDFASSKYGRELIKKSPKIATQIINQYVDQIGIQNKTLSNTLVVQFNHLIEKKGATGSHILEFLDNAMSTLDNLLLEEKLEQNLKARPQLLQSLDDIMLKPLEERTQLHSQVSSLSFASMPDRVNFIMSEMLNTENTFQRITEELNSTILPNLLKSGLISEQRYTQLFSDWKELLDASRAFAFQLEHDLSIATDSEDKVKKLFELLTSDTFNKYIAANAKIITNFNAINAAVLKLNISPEENNQLSQKIITPVQRLPRWELLITDLIKTSGQDESTTNVLNAVLKNLKDQFLAINSATLE